MWIYLLLAAGLFMGWSLGTNDAANSFGTAVATRVVKWRTAVIIIAVMIMLGAFLQGAGNIDKLASISNNNRVTADAGDIEGVGVELEKDQDGNYVLDEDGNYIVKSTENVDEEAMDTLRLKSALKAAIIFACAGLTVFIMSALKFPVSANQSITGAVIGWGLCHANYNDPVVMSTNLTEMGEFASTWLINPLGAAAISFVLVWLSKTLLEKRIMSLSSHDTVVKMGYIIAGAISAYSIGQNSSASVTAFYYDPFEVGANLLTSATLTAVIGGLAISIGVLTYSKKVMEAVGGSIAEISQVDGFVVIVAAALTVLLMGKLMGIPVSTSQSVVGAVIGAGLVRNPRSVNFKVLGKIGIAWISSPLSAGLLAYIIALLTRGYFAA